MGRRVAPGAFGQTTYQEPRKAPYQAPQVSPRAPGAEIGALFRDLRRILGLSLADLANRLGTRIDVVTALERGEIGKLPPWPETQRIIAAYTSMARIDPRPVLGFIRQEMVNHSARRPASRGPLRQPFGLLAKATATATSRVLSTTRSAASAVLGAGSAVTQSWVESEAAGMDDDVRSGAWLGRTGIMVLLLLSLSLGTYLVRSAGMDGALADLKAPVARLVDKAQTFIMDQTAGVAGGEQQLKWVDVDDPRSRRSDRLQSDPR
jgi:transcriptional regulator with XRE-family HTH domain